MLMRIFHASGQRELSNTSITFSTLLNVLDGHQRKPGLVVFLTTNKGHIEKTSAYVFYPIRMFVAILSDYLPFHPIRAALRISSTTTYPLLQGFLYGFNGFYLIII